MVGEGEGQVCKSAEASIFMQVGRGGRDVRHGLELEKGDSRREFSGVRLR